MRINQHKSDSKKYYNNVIFTIIIWSTILYRTSSTKNSTEINNTKQNTMKIVMNDTERDNFTEFIRKKEEGIINKKNYHQYLLSTVPNNETKISKLKNVKQQRSFQYPSGFMMTENSNNNDYSNQNPITPKFMMSSMTSPTSSLDQMAPPNYLRYGPHDSSASDDKEYESYSAPDEYFHHHHAHEYAPIKPYIPPPMIMAPTKPNFFSMDTQKILLIVLLKLLLIKLSTIGFIKLIILFILKLPIIFFGIIFKLLFFVKITNLFKILTLPIFLPLLLLILAPLLLPLLAPLLLLPLLLPLLLFLPIPILTLTTTTTTTTTTTAAPGRKRRRRYLDDSDSNRSNHHVWTKGRSDLEFFRLLMESEKCFERIACKLAADKNATPFASYISRVLEKVKEYLFNPRLDSYVRAYKLGATNGSTFSTCVKYYPCSKFKT